MVEVGMESAGGGEMQTRRQEQLRSTNSALNLIVFAITPHHHHHRHRPNTTFLIADLHRISSLNPLRPGFRITRASDAHIKIAAHINLGSSSQNNLGKTPHSAVGDLGSRHASSQPCFLSYSYWCSCCMPLTRVVYN